VWTVCLLLPDKVATTIWTRALLRLSPSTLTTRLPSRICCVTVTYKMWEFGSSSWYHCRGGFRGWLGWLVPLPQARQPISLLLCVCPRPNSQTLKFHSPVSPDPLNGNARSFRSLEFPLKNLRSASGLQLWQRCYETNWTNSRDREKITDDIECKRHRAQSRRQTCICTNLLSSHFCWITLRHEHWKKNSSGNWRFEMSGLKKDSRGHAARRKAEFGHNEDIRYDTIRYEMLF